MRPVRRQLARSGWTPPSGRRRAGRTTRWHPRRTRGCPRARRSSRRQRRSGTPPTAGVGCSANARSIAVVDDSRSLAVIGGAQVPQRSGAAELRGRRDLQIDAQRVQRLAHLVDDQRVFDAVLGRLCECRAVGAVGVRVRRTRRRPRERPARHPVTVAGDQQLGARADQCRARRTPAPPVTGRRDSCTRADRRRPAGSAPSGRPAAGPTTPPARAPAPPCAVPVVGSRSAASARRDPLTVLVGRSEWSPSRERPRQRSDGQDGSPSLNCVRLAEPSTRLVWLTSKGNAPTIIGTAPDRSAARASSMSRVRGAHPVGHQRPARTAEHERRVHRSRGRAGSPVMPSRRSGGRRARSRTPRSTPPPSRSGFPRTPAARSSGSAPRGRSGRARRTPRPATACAPAPSRWPGPRARRPGRRSHRRGSRASTPASRAPPCGSRRWWCPRSRRNPIRLISGVTSSTVRPASSAVTSARLRGLLTTYGLSNRSSASVSPAAFACSRPSSVRSSSVRLVCFPDRDHSVSPCRSSSSRWSENATPPILPHAIVHWSSVLRAWMAP